MRQKLCKVNLSSFSTSPASSKNSCIELKFIITLVRTSNLRKLKPMQYICTVHMIILQIVKSMWELSTLHT